MSILQKLVRAVGVEPVMRATENCCLRAVLDSSESHPSIEMLIQHLVTVDHTFLEKIARSELSNTEPGLVRRLIFHSYNCASSTKARGTVRSIANLVRCGSQLPIVPGLDPLLLTRSQQAALEKLDSLVGVFFSQADPTLPVRMRIAPLLVAPSGSGKTFLASLVAKRHGLPLIRTSVAEWMVQGSKATEPTLNLIRDTIDKHPEGLVLFVDELDKLAGSDTWSIAQRGEIFCCAGDRNITGAGWNDHHRKVLRERVFIVGSGTWQDIWTRQLTKHRGFSGPDMRTNTIEDEIRASRAIPDELLLRWGPIIPIHPYTKEDFEMIGRQLNLGPEFLNPSQAATSGLNFRAIELAVTHRALAVYENRRRAPSTLVQQ